MPALESLSEEPTDLLSALTNAEHTALASTMSTMYPLPSTHTQRLCGIVLYLVMDQKTLTDELCQTMKALDEVTLHRDIPEYIRRLLQPQVSCPIRECGSTLYVGMVRFVSFSLYITIGVNSEIGRQPPNKPIQG